MGIRVQILAITGSLALVLLILHLIRKKRLREEYSLIWLIASITLIVFAVWRGLLDHMAQLIGVFYAPAVLLLLGLFFGVLAFLHLTVEASRQADQQRIMTQEFALLKEEIEVMKQKQAQTSVDA